MGARISVWLLFIYLEFAIGHKLDQKLGMDFPKGYLWHGISVITGIVLLYFVIRIAKNTGRYLKTHGRKESDPRFFTRYLVTDGYYVCMRHPMHFSLMFFP